MRFAFSGREEIIQPVTRSTLAAAATSKNFHKQVRMYLRGLFCQRPYTDLEWLPWPAQQRPGEHKHHWLFRKYSAGAGRS